MLNTLTPFFPEGFVEVTRLQFTDAFKVLGVPDCLELVLAENTPDGHGYTEWPVAGVVHGRVYPVRDGRDTENRYFLLESSARRFGAVKDHSYDTPDWSSRYRDHMRGRR